MHNIPECFYRVSVKALVLNKERDKFLVCKEEDGQWELPGGGLDWDTSPQKDLARELMEEMGLKATYIADTPCYFITGRSTNHPEIRIANVLFETELEHLNFTPSNECIDTKFINVDDIEEMELFDGPKKILRIFRPENHR